MATLDPAITATFPANRKVGGHSPLQEHFLESCTRAFHLNAFGQELDASNCKGGCIPATSQPQIWGPVTLRVAAGSLFRPQCSARGLLLPLLPGSACSLALLPSSPGCLMIILEGGCDYLLPKLTLQGLAFP